MFPQNLPIHRAVFLDRDGVLIRKPPEGQYISSPEQVTILDGVPDALRHFRGAGLIPLVVTNQRGIARGLVSGEDVEKIHRRLDTLLAREGASVAAYYVCPHDVSEQCECRKPRPGLLLRAASEFGIHLPWSWMVGDSTSDIEAGLAAGCHTAFIGDPSQLPSTLKPDLIARDLRGIALTIDPLPQRPGTPPSLS